MASIGIVGYGIVGKAVEYGLKDKNDIKYYDKYKDSDSLEDVVRSSEFIFFVYLHLTREQAMVRE